MPEAAAGPRVKAEQVREWFATWMELRWFCQRKIDGEFAARERSADDHAGPWRLRDGVPVGTRKVFSDADKFTEAAPFLFLLASVSVFASGPGRISVDALMGKKPAAK